jgi:2-polyprenyl-3-methyl-5-hydroxy-6-metoxy-1,4-benzoquinol methylase
MEPIVKDLYKGNVQKIEMSRYIDLELYHRVERSHPFYEEMVEELHRCLRDYGKNKPLLRVLEIGAGTGLLTEELLKLDGILVDAIDLDAECCDLLSKHIDDERCRCICADAVTFCQEGMYDVVISAFSHDHIPYTHRYDFARNIKRNLKPGGVYIMGGEILPYFQHEEERKTALYAYHCFIIEKALKDKNFEVAQIEINALKSGLEQTGDFKRHGGIFEDEMVSSGLIMLQKKKIGPLDVHDVGGVFVYVYKI